MSDFWPGVVLEVPLFPLAANPEETVTESLTVEAFLPSRRSSSKVSLSAETRRSIWRMTTTKAAHVAANTTHKSKCGDIRADKHFPLGFFSDLLWFISIKTSKIKSPFLHVGNSSGRDSENWSRIDLSTTISRTLRHWWLAENFRVLQIANYLTCFAFKFFWRPKTLNVIDMSTSSTHFNSKHCKRIKILL